MAGDRRRISARCSQIIKGGAVSISRDILQGGDGGIRWKTRHGDLFF